MPAPQRYSTPRRFRPLERAPSRRPAGGSIGASLPTFHVKAADRARVAYMPGTAWPVTGSPPDSSWNLVLAPVLMPPETNFDTSTAIRSRSPSRSPPDASCAPFPTRSRQRSSANAAVGGLTPLPEERRRRATTFISHTAAQSIEVPTYMTTSPSCARGAHTIRVLSGCKRSPTCSIRSPIACTTMRAWRSERQCTTASSTYRSNGTAGNLRAIHASGVIRGFQDRKWRRAAGHERPHMPPCEPNSSTWHCGHLGCDGRRRDGGLLVDL